MLDKYKYLFLVKHNTMKKKHSITIAFLGILLAFSSCNMPKKVLTQPHASDASVLFISKLNDGLYTNRIYLILENRETHEKYESIGLATIPGSVVYNLPKGTYDVVKVWFEEEVGNTIQKFSNWSSELSEYFGPIEIEPNNKYFLGIYQCYTDEIVPWTLRNHLKLRYVEPGSERRIGTGQDYVPEKIRKVIVETDWKDGEFIMLRPAKHDEGFDFY